MQGGLCIQNNARVIFKRNLQHRAVTRTVQVQIRPRGIERGFNRHKNLIDSGQKTGFIQELAHGILDQWSVAFGRF
jgi:hypothetical protein